MMKNNQKDGTLEEHHSEDEDDEDSMSESPEGKFKILSELRDLPLSDLVKLKEKMGAKVYKEVIFGEKNESNKHQNKKTDKSQYKRENKNRPREMSSKRPVGLLSISEKQGLATNKKMTRREHTDPRFDEKCGEYDTKKFKQDFNFVTEIRENEIIDLEKKLLQTKEVDLKHKMRIQIRRLKNQNLEDRKYLERNEKLKEEQLEIQKARTEQRQPFYKTKRDRKTEDLIQKYEELKTKGTVDKFIEKQRKKNAKRDRKRLPID